MFQVFFSCTTIAIKVVARHITKRFLKVLMPFLFRLITSEVISDVRLRKPGCTVKSRTFQYNSDLDSIYCHFTNHVCSLPRLFLTQMC